MVQIMVVATVAAKPRTLKIISCAERAWCSPDASAKVLINIPLQRRNHPQSNEYPPTKHPFCFRVGVRTGSPDSKSTHDANEDSLFGGGPRLSL